MIKKLHSQQPHGRVAAMGHNPVSADCSDAV